MNYWPSAPWTGVISKPNGVGVTHEMSLPFALVGSHLVCNFRLEEVRAPELAYVAFAFEDSIEVWPLLALAYPEWGIINSNKSIRVGRTRVNLAIENNLETLKQEQEGLDSKESGNDQAAVETPHPVLQIDHQGKSYAFRLERRVVILGNGHPSTFRLHGAGLALCDHAIVNVGQSCWLINLRPKPKQVMEDLVKVLSVGSPAVKIHKMRLSFRPPNLDEVRNYRNSSEAVSLICLPRKASEPRKNEEAVRDRTLRAAESQVTEPPAVPEPSASPSSQLSFEAESVTSSVTDRLVSINRSQGWQRLLKATVFGLLFLLAVSVLGWVVIQQVLPIIIEIEGR